MQPTPLVVDDAALPLLLLLLLHSFRGAAAVGDEVSAARAGAQRKAWKKATNKRK